MNIDWIAFDADDTLWENEEVYRQGRDRCREILNKYAADAPIDQVVDRIEVNNLPYYGYGVMSFILSLLEAGVELAGKDLREKDVQELLDLGKKMLTQPPRVFKGVLEMLSFLGGSYSLMLITKGDLFHQQRKIKDSGLEKYFQEIEIVAEKTPATYQEILRRHHIRAEHFLMVGNSLRSDIKPVVNQGGWAIHVSEHLSWDHEDADLTAEEEERVIDVGRVEQVAEVLERLTAEKSG
ncbi:MAG: HAD family hydrolase [Anaerolineales bacterium]|nr:HAD family hydrolase [Anaerolineales bacterium]